MKRKSLLVSLLVIAVVIAAVVGGTYAIFTDTEAMHVQFEAGTIDIDVNGAEPGYQEFFLNPDGFDDWKPGDHAEWVLDIHNKGSNKVWIQIYVYPTGPWTLGRANLWDVATYDWDAPSPWNEWILEYSNTLHLILKVDFPQSAGNDYQGAQGDLLILVVAKQWRNKFEEGYACVALEDKDPLNNHLPDLSNNLEGIICYKETGTDGELDVVLNAYGLTSGAYYQLDLTGGDSGNPHDGACTTQDDNLAAMVPADLFSSGYWNWGATLEGTCKPASGGEGVWNYAGVYGGVQADGGGAISFGATLTGIPSIAGGYKGIGAHVKEIQQLNGNPSGPGELPGQKWPVILSEMDYLSFNP